MNGAGMAGHFLITITLLLMVAAIAQAWFLVRK